MSVPPPKVTVAGADLAAGGSRSLGSSLTRADLAWVIPSGNATESHTFYILTADRGIVYFQVVYTHVGLSPTCQVTARFSLPEKSISELRSQSLSASALCISNDRVSCTAGDSSITVSADEKESDQEQDHESESESIALSGSSSCSESDSGDHSPNTESSKRKPQKLPKFTIQCGKPSENFQLNFHFVPAGCGFKVGTGKTLFHVEGSASVTHQYIPRAAVSGTAHIHGHDYSLDGSGVYIHAITSGMRPHTIADRWSMAVFHSDESDEALLLMQYQTPKQYGAVTVSQGGYVCGNKTTAVTIKNESVFTKTELDQDTGYSPPVTVRYGWAGDTMEGTDFSAEVHMPVGLCIDRVDILGELPYLLRMFVQTFVAKPFIYQWLQDKTTMTIKTCDEERQVRGRVFHEATFIKS